ncbi:DUF5666 domain-containing protein [Rhizobium hainanense]|uniref:DUF5666 domain-containing protein n=1 Tax=Rhizobium hainanense TaxID=52131 RepID=A0A1C3VHX4_9HYPH|nr:DUF5666 domain-containing protein [Rhizobium hainanense]SCB27341.1 hypothetical protein GA0061100_106145 [Rhizobium hainanense]
MTSIRLYRRRFLKLASVSPVILASLVNAQDFPPPIDHGIGGTGNSLKGGDDHGIGGTGIFGTIKRFGSIYVNGHRITYSPDVPIYLDGIRANARAMRLGQVVRVALAGSLASPVASAIYVTSEVTGRVESIDTHGLVVLSQRIELTPQTSLPKLKLGMIVSVYGIRKPDGVIVASLIERRSRRTHPLLRGVATNDSGRLKIGDLTLDLSSDHLVGRRVVVDFAGGSGDLHILRVKEEELVPGLNNGNINIETYAESDGHAVNLGIGITLSGAKAASLVSRSHVYLDLAISGGDFVSSQRQAEPLGPNPLQSKPQIEGPASQDGRGHGAGPERSDGPGGQPR